MSIKGVYSATNYDESIYLYYVKATITFIKRVTTDFVRNFTNVSFIKNKI